MEGFLREEEMRQFVEQALTAVRSLGAQGREVRVLADMSRLRTASPEAAALLQWGQAEALRLGLKRIAEIVGSELTTLQLNRIARGSGMDRILRRFQNTAEARRWLIEGTETLGAA